MIISLSSFCIYLHLLVCACVCAVSIHISVSIYLFPAPPVAGPVADLKAEINREQPSVSVGSMASTATSDEDEDSEPGDRKSSRSRASTAGAGNAEDQKYPVDSRVCVCVYSHLPSFLGFSIVFFVVFLRSLYRNALSIYLDTDTTAAYQELLFSET